MKITVTPEDIAAANAIRASDPLHEKGYSDYCPISQAVLRNIPAGIRVQTSLSQMFIGGGLYVKKNNPCMKQVIRLWDDDPKAELPSCTFILDDKKINEIVSEELDAKPKRGTF